MHLVTKTKCYVVIRNQKKILVIMNVERIEEMIGGKEIIEETREGNIGGTDLEREV